MVSPRNVVDSNVTPTFCTAYAYQRKSFFVNGLYWVFYCDGTNMSFRSSADGIYVYSASNESGGIVYDLGYVLE